MQRSLWVLDGSVAIFDDVAGVEPQSETVCRQVDKYCVLRMCMELYGHDHQAACGWPSGPSRSIGPSRCERQSPRQPASRAQKYFRNLRHHLCSLYSRRAAQTFAWRPYRPSAQPLAFGKVLVRVQTRRRCTLLCTMDRGWQQTFRHGGMFRCKHGKRPRQILLNFAAVFTIFFR